MTVTELTIRGLFTIELDVFDDERGSFREAWQAEKMITLGLPEFHPVQQNISESKEGVLRGIHAEPWNKLAQMAHGTAFGAYVDLREDSPTFGIVETVILDRKIAVFIPKGLGNSYQVLSPTGVYVYLVDAHWQAGTTYSAIAFNDPDLAIDWPIRPEIVSEKDAQNKTIRDHYPHIYNT